MAQMLYVLCLGLSMVYRSASDLAEWPWCRSLPPSSLGVPTHAKAECPAEHASFSAHAAPANTSLAASSSTSQLGQSRMPPRRPGSSIPARDPAGLHDSSLASPSPSHGDPANDHGHGHGEGPDHGGAEAAADGHSMHSVQQRHAEGGWQSPCPSNDDLDVQPRTVNAGPWSQHSGAQSAHQEGEESEDPSWELAEDSQQQDWRQWEVTNGHAGTADGVPDTETPWEEGSVADDSASLAEDAGQMSQQFLRKTSQRQALWRLPDYSLVKPRTVCHLEPHFKPAALTGWVLPSNLHVDNTGVLT